MHRIPDGLSEAPRAPARGICGKAKRNSAVATRLRPTGYAAVACCHFIGPKPWRRPILPVLPHGASWGRRVKLQKGAV